MIKIFNSMTKQKETFQPLKDNIVSMYVCGMTVYDYCHVGHARVMVVFDMVTRFLRSQGYTVNYVRNITDIDDKIINRANENNEDFNQLTERFIQAMNEDATALEVIPPDIEPKATEYMPQIISMIETLIEKDFAYVAENGDVYYAVEKFSSYGCLSKKKLDELQVGARIDVEQAKRNPSDFVLWKVAKPNEPSWLSPWGEGRPGWHIECSAMSTSCLGHTFDIHGGGGDLLFPHHENEIAQSEAATDEKYVNTWMHVGFVQVNEEKMSKSLGNFFTIREVLNHYNPEVLRYFIIASHYRSPLNYSQENLQSAFNALERFYLTLRDHEVDANYELDNNEYTQQFYAAMSDDFNTPEALAILFELVRQINRLTDDEKQIRVNLASQLKALAGILGFLQQDPIAFLQNDAGIDKHYIEELIEDRNQARAEKNWAEADRIRDELHAMGVELEDGSGGTTWRREIE